MSPREQFRSAMRKLASTVCIITTAERNGRRALLATSVTSASLEPPAVLFCVSKAASIHGALKVGAECCVNLLSGPADWGYLSGSGLMTATNMGRLAGIAAAKLLKR
jgi:flavin reductase (DIM6/NTAB) family NADH-FMN oxidoreductase RutF